MIGTSRRSRRARGRAPARRSRARRCCTLTPRPRPQRTVARRAAPGATADRHRGACSAQPGIARARRTRRTAARDRPRRHRRALRDRARAARALAAPRRAAPAGRVRRHGGARSARSSSRARGPCLLLPRARTERMPTRPGRPSPSQLLGPAQRRPRPRCVASEVASRSSTRRVRRRLARHRAAARRPPATSLDLRSATRSDHAGGSWRAAPGVRVRSSARKRLG